MANLNGELSLKRALVSSSAPTPPKRSINGLSLMLSQRLSSTPHVPLAEPKDAETSPSPPSAAAAGAAALAPVPSARADTNKVGELTRVGGHFAQFRSQDFEPDASAPFSDEWERLRASQGWVPGSQVYKRERAQALRNELRACYFPPSGIKIKEEQIVGPSRPLIKLDEEYIIEEEGGAGEDCAGELLALKTKGEADEDGSAMAELMGFQAMCKDVGQQPGNTVDECKTILRATLVNIVDLIDTHRTGQAVQVWTDFESFREYTMRPDKTIPLEQAKDDELLRCFLKKLGAGSGRLRDCSGRSGSKKSAKRKSPLGSGLIQERERKRHRRET